MSEWPAGSGRVSLSGVRRTAALLVALLLIFFLDWSLAGQERGPFDGVAADVAGAIIRVSRGSPLRVEAAVGDFTEQDGKVTPLGIALADEFSAALAGHAKGFEVIDRRTLTGADPVYRPTAGDLTDPNVTKCYGLEPGAAVVITATITELSDRVVLWIRGEEYHSPMFDRRITIPLTAEMKTLLSQPLSRPTPEKLSWVNPEHPPIPNEDAPKSGTKGAGHPACIYCPQPQYSGPATIAKIQGTVTLDVIISADGFPAKITLVKGLPCGLSASVIESVKRWRFKPALDSNGKPMEVRQIIDVGFHLY